MPTRTVYSYPENNPYDIGDIVYYGEERCVVGNDYEELCKWGKEESNEYIVTTNGRVLHISQVTPYPVKR